MMKMRVDHGEFWHIRFKHEVVEWQFLMAKLLGSVKVEVFNDWIRTKHDESGDDMFMLKKKRYPIELLSKTFGISEETIRSLDMIVLDAPKTRKDLPMPTVDYWGTA